jgi:hypothetical protein
MLNPAACFMLLQALCCCMLYPATCFMLLHPYSCSVILNTMGACTIREKYLRNKHAGCCVVSLGMRNLRGLELQIDTWLAATPFYLSTIATTHNLQNRNMDGRGNIFKDFLGYLHFKKSGKCVCGVHECNLFFSRYTPVKVKM